MNPQERVEPIEFIKRVRNDFDPILFVIEHHMDVIMSICERMYILNFRIRTRWMRTYVWSSACFRTIEERREQTAGTVPRIEA
jgi:ABC-type molybdate transport system ATPase subunit